MRCTSRGHVIELSFFPQSDKATATIVPTRSRYVRSSHAASRDTGMQRSEGAGRAGG